MDACASVSYESAKHAPRRAVDLAGTSIIRAAMTQNIGLDDLAGDIFNLNIRGLRTIAVLWRNPGKYFDAASDPDWQDRFTPSIRLWLSMIALASLLQFLWLGSDTPLVAAFAQGFRDAGVELQDGLTYEAIGETAAVWIFAAFPVVQLLTFLFILPLFQIWGRETTYSLRVRYGFAMMTPSASVMLLLLPSMALLAPEQVSAFGVAIGVLAWLIDAVTMYRGASPGRTRSGRLLRAGVMAAIILTLNVVTNVATQIAGIVMISARYGLVTS